MGRRSRTICHVLLCFNFISYLVFPCHSAFSSITAGQSITDGQTLISQGKIFELGFFSPGDFDLRYLGMWYYNLPIRRIVWVANRNDPIMGSSGVLTIGRDGNLVLSDGRGERVWSSNASSIASHRPVTALVLESGNLVLMEGNLTRPGQILWQSFDHATDVLLPGMKIGIDSKTSVTRNLISWKNSSDPSPGSFSFGIDPQQLRQFFIWRGSSPYWKTIYWDGVKFVLLPQSSQALLHYQVNSSEEGVFFTYSIYSKSYPSLLLDPSGKIYLIWYSKQGAVDMSEEMNLWSGPETSCSEFGACGAFASCNEKYKPVCRCLPGFEPVAPKDWRAGIWSSGCSRRTALQCGAKDQFLVLPGMGVMDSESTDDGPGNVTADSCRAECLIDCNCTAYAWKEKGKDLVCQLWKEDLQDLKEAEEGVEALDLHLRLPASELKQTVARQCPNCGANTVPYPLSTSPDCGDPYYSRFYCNLTNGELNFNMSNGSSYAITSITSKSRRFVIQQEDADICWPDDGKSKDIQLGSGLPFHLTGRNTILLFNCTTPSLLLPLNCTLSLCKRYVQEGPASCLNSGMCCSYVPGDHLESTLHSVGVLATGCSAYTSIVEANFSQPAINWQRGLEIGWDEPPEPVCNSSTDCSPNSVCLSDRNMTGRKRCICNDNYKWDPLTFKCMLDYARTEGIHGSTRRKMKLLASIIAITVVIGALLIGSSGWCFCRKIVKEKGTEGKTFRRPLNDSNERALQDMFDKIAFNEDGRTDLVVPCFSFESVAAATGGFADSNKLGQGGFGPVYWGKFPNGQEVAIKRLSRSSGQGLEEFKNEVLLIAKLQHRNLVRILGYCIEGNEKILLYEFMPNKSLDSFIFDRNHCKDLDWERRFNIILGIARGLLYLHQDSRLRIIHRDLKTSNILLDHDMNPKISDFGMARMFGENQVQANTNRVVGTYGYMSPEYASHGHFSVKSDVFSFGVIVLEIISGKKNSHIYQSHDSLTLLGQAWILWKEGEGLDLMDTSLGGAFDADEVLKCIKVGLLCTQEDARDRPTIASVVAMLTSKATTPIRPKQPAFFFSLVDNKSPSGPTSACTRNDLTMSTVDGR